MEQIKKRIKGTFLEPMARRLHGFLVKRPVLHAPSEEEPGLDEAIITEDVKRYDIQTMEVMKRILAQDSGCVDVGAHEGDVLQEMVSLAPKGRHHAFEPLPRLAQALRQRFPRAKIHQVALSDENGEARFHHVVNSPGYSGLLKRDYDRLDPVFEMILVRKARLDDLIEQDEPVDLIKVDVEGGEYHVLRGGMETLKRCKPWVVFEAGSKSTLHYGVGPENLHQLLVKDCGLRISTMERWLEGKTALDEASFLRHFHEGLDYYFLAYDPDKTPRVQTSSVPSP